MLEPGDRLWPGMLNYNIPIDGALLLHDFDTAVEPGGIFACKTVGFEVAADLGARFSSETLGNGALEGGLVARRVGAAPLAEVQTTSGRPFWRRSLTSAGGGRRER